ncbi:MAG: Hsp20/alpha crystallin family protein [Planctomycetota bacterium]|jgi:HSP20 family protein|nr:Hsp20/alpha crystallin family protein [Planctomycetota bacterium]
MSTKSLFANRLFKPLEEFERLHREFDRLFSADPTLKVRRHGLPALNAWVSEDSAVIESEIPGIKTEDLDISVHGRRLTITGKRESEEGNYLRRERESGEFRRQIELPFAVNAETVEASYDNGVLKVNLPRAESDKPRAIPINHAD